MKDLRSIFTVGILLASMGGAIAQDNVLEITLTGNAADENAPINAIDKNQSTANAAAGSYIVRFNDDTFSKPVGSNIAVNKVGETVEQAIQRVMRELTGSESGGVGNKIHHIYDHTLHGFAGDFSETLVTALRAHEEIEIVYEDGDVQEFTAGQNAGVKTWEERDSFYSNALDALDERKKSGPYDRQFRYGYQGEGATIYVIDSLVQADHEEFLDGEGNSRVISHNAARDDGNCTSDRSSHGTAVASAAAGNRMGTAPMAEIVSVGARSCINTQRRLKDSGIVAAINYVVGEISHAFNRPARPIVVMSFGSKFKNPGENRAVRDLDRNGALVFAAVGNSEKNACKIYPARLPQAISVSGRNTAGSHILFKSNSGDCVRLSAPGADVKVASGWSGRTRTDLYRGATGTSFSAPLAAGAAAMAWEAHPNASAQQIANIIVENSSKDLFKPNKKAGDEKGLRSPDRFLYAGSGGQALATLGGTNDKAFFGRAIASGDFNGDGYKDLAISNSDDSDGGKGKVVMLYGRNAQLLPTKYDHGNHITRPAGLQPRAPVVFTRKFLLGTRSDNVTALAKGLIEQLLEGTSFYDLNGEDQFGRALAAGDFNNDGYDDLAIGAPRARINERNRAGEVHVLYGTSQGLTKYRYQWLYQGKGNGSETVPGSPGENNSFGYSLVAADFTGDGFDDLAIGTPGQSNSGKVNTGSVTVLTSFGQKSLGLHLTGSRFWQNKNDEVLGRPETNDRFGEVLAAGDLNSDGKADLVVGVPFEDNSGGVVQLFWGTSGHEGVTLSNNQMWLKEEEGGYGDEVTHQPQRENEKFGRSLAVGDFNADGHNDLAIGVPGYNSAKGQVIIVPGQNGGLNKNRDSHKYADYPSHDSANFGSALAAVKRNPHAAGYDLVIGASNATTSNNNAGRIYKAVTNQDLGRVMDIKSMHPWSMDRGGMPEGTRRDFYGSSLAIGDFNKDGRHDIAVGLPHRGDGIGAVSVIYTNEAQEPSAFNNQFWTGDSH